MTNTSTDVSFNFELRANVSVNTNLTLHARQFGSDLILTAPSDAHYFQLLAATNLTTPGQWSPPTNAPQFIGGEWRVTLPVTTNGQRFFRLQGE